MSEQYLITGCLIGMLFGMPIGAIGALSMQRTMSHGIYAGLVTGIASSIADIVYACIGAFGITFLSDFLFTYQLPIHIAGALFLVILAIKMIRNKDIGVEKKEPDKKGYLSMFLSSFAVALTNPAAIISFLFAFSVFGIDGTLRMTDGILLIIGVFAGTFLWWISLVFFIHVMKQKFKNRWYARVNVIFGVILIMFGIGILIRMI